VNFGMYEYDVRCYCRRLLSLAFRQEPVRVWNHIVAPVYDRRYSGVLARRYGMSLLEAGRLQARLAVVGGHIRVVKPQDLDAVMATFGVKARYDDEPWDDHRTGQDGVRSYYTELMRALPDLAIEVKERHVASDSLIVEVIIRGTHLGMWRGLPATGRQM